MMNITYKEDIIKRLCVKYNMSTEEITEIIDLTIRYIHKLTKTPEVITIKLGNLGSLYFCTRRLGKNFRVNRIYRYDTKMLEDRLELITETQKTVKDMAHHRIPFIARLRRYYFKNKLERIQSTKVELYKKQEDKQNKAVDKF